MASSASLSLRGVRNAWDNVAASTTDEVLVAAVSGRQIVVRSVVINQGDTTASSVVFNSKGSGAGTAISPTLKAAANGGFVIPDDGKGWFATKVSEGLSVSTGSGSTTGIIVGYEWV